MFCTPIWLVTIQFRPISSIKILYTHTWVSHLINTYSSSDSRWLRNLLISEYYRICWTSLLNLIVVNDRSVFELSYISSCSSGERSSVENEPPRISSSLMSSDRLATRLRSYILPLYFILNKATNIWRKYIFAESYTNRTN